LSGGVIALTSSQPLTTENYALLQVFLLPDPAVQAGALWHLSTDPSNFWSVSGAVRKVTNDSVRIEYNNFPGGWSQPTNDMIHLIPLGTVTTNLYWRPPANLAVTATGGLSFTGYAGGTFNSNTVTLSNSAGPTSCDLLTWDIAQSTNWLSFSSTRGSLLPGAWTSITFTATNTSSLAAGIYTNT